MLKHGSLFSGFGGFDLASQWMGWENVFHCEWNEFCQQLLNYYWPNSICYEDITKTDFSIHRGQISVITGGFPCQPYSVAGKRLGKSDERHLWPEMCRAIREIQPRWVVGENVYGLLNWSKGLVFHEVQSDLENEGYEVFPYILPASSVGAPHKRDRIFFVAFKDNFITTDSTNTENKRSGGLPNKVKEARSRKGNIVFRGCDSIPNWDGFPTQSPICSGNDGLPTRLDGITVQKWRNESLKGYGNAVVPQIPYIIFKAIEDYENYLIENKNL